MAEFGNFIIYIIMAGTLIGALASIVKPEGELGREFVNGIHAIGPVFLARAGIMAAIPIISYLIMYSIGPFFSALGSDASIAALAVIAVDMGGYQLADAIAANRDMWIVAMLVGYTSGASIVYLIPVGLIMLNRDDHKYLALGAMAGLISIPFAVLIAPVTITFNNLPVRAIISTTSPAAHYLQLDFLQALRLLSPLFALCFLLALGLKLRPAAMVKGFLIFGKAADAFIKLVLALCIIEHFTGVFKRCSAAGYSIRYSPTKTNYSALSRLPVTSALCWRAHSPFVICSSAIAASRCISSAENSACRIPVPRALLWCWPISSRFITCSKACGRAIRCCASPSASVRKPHWAITGVYRQLPTFAGAADHDGQIPRRHDCRANRHQDLGAGSRIAGKNRRKGSRRPSPPPLAEFSLSHKNKRGAASREAAPFSPRISIIERANGNEKDIFGLPLQPRRRQRRAATLYRLQRGRRRYRARRKRRF